MPQFPTLPLLEDVHNEYYHGIQPLRDVGLVCLQHLLETTGSLFEKLVQLGLRPENTFVQGKIYSTNSDVVERLRRLGFQNSISERPFRSGHYEMRLQQDVENLWAAAASVLKSSRVKQVVALDDGGFLLAGVPESIRVAIPVTGVEQTMGGIALQEAGRVRMPVVQVATSAGKKLVEPPMIQEAVFRRVSDVAPEFGSQICGVIGLGSIGRAVLSALLRTHSRVLVFDRNQLEIEGMLPDGVVMCNSLQDLFESAECIFGCTGNDVLNGSSWWKHVPRSKTLISCSSHDKEFRTILRDCDEREKNALDPLADVVVQTLHGHFKVVRGGFPINFDGSPESVPARDIQLTRSLLLGGIIQAATSQFDRTPGYKSIVLDPRLQCLAVNRWFELRPERTIFYSDEDRQLFSSPEDVAQYGLTTSYVDKPRELERV